MYYDTDARNVETLSAHEEPGKTGSCSDGSGGSGTSETVI